MITHYKHSLLHQCFQLFEVSYPHRTTVSQGLHSLPTPSHAASTLSWLEARQKLQLVPEPALEAADSLPKELWLGYVFYTDLIKSFA